MTKFWTYFRNAEGTYTVCTDKKNFDIIVVVGSEKIARIIAIAPKLLDMLQRMIDNADLTWEERAELKETELPATVNWALINEAKEIRKEARGEHG